MSALIFLSHFPCCLIQSLRFQTYSTVRCLKSVNGRKWWKEAVSTGVGQWLGWMSLNGWMIFFLLSPVRHSKRWTPDHRERLGSCVQPRWEDEGPRCALLRERSGEVLICPLPAGNIVHSTQPRAGEIRDHRTQCFLPSELLKDILTTIK